MGSLKGHQGDGDPEGGGAQTPKWANMPKWGILGVPNGVKYGVFGGVYRTPDTRGSGPSGQRGIATDIWGSEDLGRRDLWMGTPGGVQNGSKMGYFEGSPEGSRGPELGP